MTYRRIQSFTVGTVTATVGRSAKWQEFRVRLSVHGVAYPAADYFTSYRNEAIIASKTLARQMFKSLTAGL